MRANKHLVGLLSVPKPLVRLAKRAQDLPQQRARPTLFRAALCLQQGLCRLFGTVQGQQR